MATGTTGSEPRQTLDQRRAAHAWRKVGAVEAELPKAAQKEFGTQAKKLPTRIMTAGLGQALAFLEAKGRDKDGYQRLLSALKDWIHELRPTDGDRRLVVRLIHGDADFLRYATSESLAYLQWIVRFADAKGLTSEFTKEG